MHILWLDFFFLIRQNEFIVENQKSHIRTNKKIVITENLTYLENSW